MTRLLLILSLLLLPIQAWAYPDNSVLDTFTGADGTTPPSATWTNGVLGDASGALKIMANGAISTSATALGDAWWETIASNANCEAYFTILSFTGSNVEFDVGCRMVNIGANTSDGYNVRLHKGTNVLTIRRVDNGVQFVLGANITRTSAVGDLLGIRIVGDRICAWFKSGAAAWAEQGCRTDSTYAAAGYLMAGVRGTNTIPFIDDFGGGGITVCGGGPSPTWTAPAIDQITVRDCIDAATTGDTINLPAGSATWTTTVTGQPPVTLSKGVTLHGETVCSGSPTTCVDNTIILDGTGTTDGSNVFGIGGTNARVTGISFQDPRGGTVDSKPEISMSCANCRFDHNSVVDTNTAFYKTHGVWAYSKTDSSILIDHNYFQNLNGGVDVYGANTALDGVYVGSYNWSQPLGLGDANAVYIEDNNFDDTANLALDGASDNYAGARFVMRYNYLHNNIAGSHGLDSGPNYRSVMRQEFYRNIMDNDGTALSSPFSTRGGTHMYWDNTLTGFNSVMWVRNYRSSDTQCTGCASWGATCAGSNYIDQNTASAQGYACRDQVGRGPNSSAAAIALDWPTITDPSAVYSQVLVPSYSWGNSRNGSAAVPSGYGIFSWEVNNLTIVQTYHILRDREFYTEPLAAFDGSTGVGKGTIAARPMNCTAGVAYFATNQGSWNSSSTDAAYVPSGVAGEDGILFHCTATGTPGTWDTVGTGAYTPYDYPHPLQAFTGGGGGGGLPTAPTNLRLISQAHNNSACLTWTASGMANLTGYRVYHGTASGNYTLAAEIPLTSYTTRHSPVTQYCYQSATGGTHYFSVTAYDNATLESDLATEVSATFTALARATATARSGR